MYAIRYTKNAIKTLRKIPRNTRKLIETKLLEYAEHPEGGRNVIQLEGREGFRMRVGDWRVLFDIDDGEVVIVVLKVAPRGGVYR
ncbi:type II toxin-antitoxin system RelE family toxin [Endothiovibrio diazotrophicus]